MICRCFLVLSLLAPPVLGGAFFGSAAHLGNACEQPGCGPLDILCPCSPFIVVHPVGYTSAGIGGEIEIPICIRPGDAPFVQLALVQSIDIWNGLAATLSNCSECLTADEAPPTDGVLMMDTTLLHELGHCAFGLDHSNYQVDPMAFPDNFTAGTGLGISAVTMSGYDIGPDSIRGSKDDEPVDPPLPPPDEPRVTHWFRKADNDPVVIDATPIDFNTYSILKTDLPATASTWPASANRIVAQNLGAGANTQSVMHSVSVRKMLYTGLSADDVNTVRYGMAGLDATAGTADDYTVRLALVDDCADADIEVTFEPLSGNTLGICQMELAPIDPVMPPVGFVHYAARPNPAVSVDRIVIEMNSDTEWDVIFFDGFESGDLSSWSTP